MNPAARELAAGRQRGARPCPLRPRPVGRRRGAGVHGATLIAAVAAAIGQASWARAAADDRPNEDALFGGSATAAPAAPASAGNSRTAVTGGRGAGGAPGSAQPPGAPAAPGIPDPPTAPTSTPTPETTSRSDDPRPGAVPSAPGAPATPAAGISAPSPEGSPAPAAAAAQDDSRPVPPSLNASRDDALLGGGNGGPKLSADVAPDDPLKIGGQIYLRAQGRVSQGQSLGDGGFSAPALVDGYFDARPNDRVRGFVLGRLFFDPTLPVSAAPVSSVDQALLTAGVPQLSGQQQTRGPTAALDQLWLRFDIAHTVFVTAGRQHVKWGTGRFWTPTDFLHPQLRNPIAAFDARTGFTMLKLHLPIETLGWNLYAFGLIEGAPQVDSAGRTLVGGDTANTLRQLGGALRAEIVLGAAELGLDSVLYANRRPKVGADLSFGIGDLDLYLDAGFRAGSEIAERRYNPNTVDFVPPAGPNATADQNQQAFANWVDAQYPVAPRSGIKPQLTVGGTYSLKYNDNDVFTITGEYFYNSVGYTDPHVYPGLFLSNSFQFFYTGRHYGSLSFVAAAPYSWNYTTFSLTTLANVSDQSLISRLDYSLVLLTHLRFEAFGAVNYGREAGEFRLGVKDFNIQTANGPLDTTLLPQLFSLGVGLRVSI